MLIGKMINIQSVRSRYYFNISQFVKSLNDNFKLKSFLECLIIMRIWYGMFRSLNITGATFIGVYGFANGLHSIKTGPRTLHLN